MRSLAIVIGTVMSPIRSESTLGGSALNTLMRCSLPDVSARVPYPYPYAHPQGLRKEKR